MLTAQQVAWKNDANARAWCKLMGYRFLHTGAFSVYYVTPAQEGKQMDSLAGMIDAYSSKNWLFVFEDLDKAGIEKLGAPHEQA